MTRRSHIHETGSRARVAWARSWWPAAIVAAAGLILTGLAFDLVDRADKARVQGILELGAEWRARDFQRKIELAAGPVVAAAAFVASQPAMEPGSAEAGEFSRFAAQVGHSVAAIRALSWSPRIARDQRPALEARARAGGAPEFRIYEQDQSGAPVPAPDRPETYPILIQVPFEGQSSVVGYDQASEPSRRRALALAAAGDTLVSTPAIKLIILSRADPSYLVFAPVYEGEPGAGDRRLRGVIAGTFRVRAVLAEAIAGTSKISSAVAFHLGTTADGDDVLASPDSLVAVYSPAKQRIDAAFAPDDPVAASPYRVTRTFDVMGQRWRLDFAVPPAFVAQERSSAPLIALLAGLLLTAALSAYVARERGQKARIEDVVEAQTAELSRSHASLSDLVANIPLGTCLVGADLRVRALNRLFLDELGLSADTIKPGDPFETFLRAMAARGLWPAGEDVEARIRQRLAMVRNPKGGHTELTLDDGRAFEVWTTPLADGGFVTSRLDITERQRRAAALEEAGRALKSANANLLALIDASPLPIISLDATRCVLTWNRAAERHFGYAAAEVLGRPDPLVPAGGEAEADRLFQRCAAGESPRDVAVKRRHKDGRSLDVVFSGASISNAGRALIVSVLEDVTGKKKLEQQVAQAVKMDAVGQLTGGIAHDFNNILGVVVGNLDELNETLDRPELGAVAATAKTLGTAALDAALHGAELVRRLLAFSRRQPLQPRLLDLAGIVRDVEPLLRRALGEAITLQSRLGEHLWPVEADRAGLESVLLNLAVNARDAMPNGGLLTIAGANAALDTAAVATLEIPPGDYVCLSVADRGTGISPDVLAKVFEPFFTTKDVGKGSGLGLSMVYGYARQSGGTVKIYSEVGHGTEVRVYLPRADRAAAAPGAEPAAVDAPAVVGGVERILVVEDAAEVRTMARRVLSSLGYQVIDADSAAAALTLVDSGAEFDLLFTDIVMPGGASGIDLAREIRRRFPERPIVLTSGFSDPGTVRSEATALGATLIGKPYRKADLAQHLRLVLDSTNGARPAT